MSSTEQQPWTIKRLLDWTTDYFSETSVGSPRLEAETLLSESLDCERIELYTRYAEVPDDARLARFRAWVKRRGAGEPVAYLVGYREFYSLRFAVDSNVLIPRPETEHVVMAAEEAAKKLDADPIRIIDVGTGSGCIAVTLAKHIKNSKIAAIDISEPALAIARTNAETHKVDDRVRFYQGDLLDALPNGTPPVHLIVSNPPYIGKKEIDTVDEQVKNHEPAIALFSGDHGTEIIERLLQQSEKFLLPGGFLIFESSPIVMDTCKQRVESSQLFETIKITKDFSGLDRVVIARRSQ